MAEGKVFERQVSVAAQSCQEASEESKKYVEHCGQGLTRIAATSRISSGTRFLLPTGIGVGAVANAVNP
jgi:hypothetical protein